ncbi:MAG: hypothetical protein IJS46_01205, partial [Kiritimatiellae bacterium]|nr:hypothetical protein [Kiritimatiellia bacterium]
MRLFELAQALKTSDRDLFRQTQALGLEIPNIVSVVEEDDERRIRDAFKRPLEADIVAENRRVAEALAAKSAVAAGIVATEREADAAALDAARERARKFLRLTHEEVAAPVPAV